jgi:hypothetical protein
MSFNYISYTNIFLGECPFTEVQDGVKKYATKIKIVSYVFFSWAQGIGRPRGWMWSERENLILWNSAR